MNDLSNRESEVRCDIEFLQEQLTDYSAASVVAIALERLAKPKPWTFEDAKAMPGLTLLVVKWVVQNPNVRMFLGKEMTHRDFDGIGQRIWDIQGKAKQGVQNVIAMVRSLLPVQIDFQRRSPWAFMRWPSLIAALPEEHPSRIQFRRLLGVSPEQFIDACWILLPPVVNGKLQIDLPWLTNLPSIYKRPVDTVLNALGKDFLGLRSELSSHWPSYRPSSWEFFESPFAKRFPLLKVAENTWRIWHPAMLERGLEEAVHLRLAALGSQYTETFSKVFETYVVDLALEIHPDLITEEQWKSFMGVRASSVEAIVPLGDKNLFIEAKMSLFHDSVLIEDTEQGLFNRLERVFGAVQQGWKVSKLLRDRRQHFPRRADAEEDFLIVVTNRELHVGGGLALKRLLPEGSLDYLDEVTAKILPLENIFMLSIETFERLQQVVLQKKAQMLDVLIYAKKANTESKTSAMYFDDHLKKYTSNWGKPALIEAATAEAVERLKATFP